MLKIAIVNNVSALAYRCGFAPLIADIQPMSPTRVFKAAMRSNPDAALLPVASLRHVAHTYEPLGSFGIACRGSVYSVGYFGRRSLSEMLQLGLPIYLSEDSQTSRRLFLYLSAERYGAVPLAAHSRDDAEGALLIGDDALSARLQPDRWPCSVDLGEWWFERTRLPFVFAIWVCRRDLAPDARFELLRWLSNTCDAAESDAGRVAIHAQLTELGYGTTLSGNYARALHYRLALKDRHAMQMFRALLAKGTSCAMSG